MKLLLRTFFANHEKVIHQGKPEAVDVLLENALSGLLHLNRRPADLGDKVFVHVTADICVLGGDAAAPEPKGMKKLGKVCSSLSQELRHTAVGILQDRFTVQVRAEGRVERRLSVCTMGEGGEDVDGGGSKVDCPRALLICVALRASVMTKA